jgi:hypothetical protein
MPVPEYYTFAQRLEIGSDSIDVEKLETIMLSLKYFNETPDTLFDEQTRIALTQLLKNECDWPKTTQ